MSPIYGTLIRRESAISAVTSSSAKQSRDLKGSTTSARAFEVSVSLSGRSRWVQEPSWCLAESSDAEDGVCTSAARMPAAA